jgi:hypothetical protein
MENGKWFIGIWIAKNNDWFRFPDKQIWRVDVPSDAIEMMERLYRARHRDIETSTAYYAWVSPEMR